MRVRDAIETVPRTPAGVESADAGEGSAAESGEAAALAGRCEDLSDRAVSRHVAFWLPGGRHSVGSHAVPGRYSWDLFTADRQYICNGGRWAMNLTPSTRLIWNVCGASLGLATTALALALAGGSSGSYCDPLLVGLLYLGLSRGDRFPSWRPGTQAARRD